MMMMMNDDDGGVGCTQHLKDLQPELGRSHTFVSVNRSGNHSDQQKKACQGGDVDDVSSKRVCHVWSAGSW